MENGSLRRPVFLQEQTQRQRCLTSRMMHLSWRLVGDLGPLKYVRFQICGVSLLLASVSVANIWSPAEQLPTTTPEKSPEKLPAFEVVSIRAHEPGYWPSFERREFTADGLTWLNTQAQGLIVFAYNLRDPKLGPNLIPGAPKWIRSDWYDIRARLSAQDAETMARLNSQDKERFQRQLLRSVLLDRFKLKAHLVSKPSLSYELVIAKRGIKIKEARPGESSGIDWIDAGDGLYHAVPLDALVMLLQMQENCPVIDKTGLKGKYDFELKWERAPETMPAPGTSIVPVAPAGEPSRPSIFKALEEELGLKLIPMRAPIENIVIDHIEKPSPN